MMMTLFFSNSAQFSAIQPHKDRNIASFVSETQMLTFAACLSSLHYSSALVSFDEKQSYAGEAAQAVVRAPKRIERQRKILLLFSLKISLFW